MFYVLQNTISAAPPTKNPRCACPPIPKLANNKYIAGIALALLLSVTLSLNRNQQIISDEEFVYRRLSKEYSIHFRWKTTAQLIVFKIY